MAKKKRKAPGLPPGSLIFTGKKVVAFPNVTLMQYSGEECYEQTVQDRIPEARQGDGLVSWYDIRGLNNVQLIEALGRRFNIHSLALEDVLNTGQRPKMDEYDNGVFLIVEAMTWDPDRVGLRSEQVAIFTTADTVISFQEDEADLFPMIRERLNRASGKIRRRGADYLTYALVDSIVDHYYLILDQMEEVIEAVEREIVANPTNLTRSRIHHLKLAALRLRKASAPAREAINRLYRTDNPIFSQETSVFIRDLHDHIAQITDSIETYRDMINGIHDLYLSEIGFKTNSVIQILTIVSTIFIPLTFLVGVYGMNFHYMPELRWRYGYFILWGIMILIVIAQIIYYRRRKWL